VVDVGYVVAVVVAVAAVVAAVVVVAVVVVAVVVAAVVVAVVVAAVVVGFYERLYPLVLLLEYILSLDMVCLYNSQKYFQQSSFKVISNKR